MSGSSSEKQESVIRPELKRCISIERCWNRNEVSRESPDKEVNRRPTLLKKFRANELRGQGSQLRPVAIYNQEEGKRPTSISYSE